MVVVSGAAQPKAVELGINDGQNVQVLSGLTPSDLVITSGSFGLDPGTKVKVGPADAGSAAAGNSAAAGDPDAAGQGGGDD
jgi:multidrug efflux pump subunit AcrA (membrane-fusion protein)